MKRWLIFLVGVCWAVGQVTAQSDTLLYLTSDTTSLQTGQHYPITIHVDNVTDLWLANLEITYDPQAVYLIGTVAGSPVRVGDFWGEGALPLQNVVQTDHLNYSVSLVAPSTPLTGGGNLGEFTIVPLRAGTTQLTFRYAELTKVNFSETEAGNVGTSTTNLPFSPALLELTIIGDPVMPPSESTATPTPTVTPPPLTATATTTAVPTLVNVTLDPNRTSVQTTTPTVVPLATLALTDPNSVTAPSTVNNVLVAVLGMIGVVVLGILGLVVYRIRRT